MPNITVNAINLYYELTGKGDPLVLVSGFTTNHHIWDPFVEELSKKYSVLTFDNRGVGQSTIPEAEFTVETMATDTKLLMDALKIPKAHIVGASMGSAISMTLAHLYPGHVDKLILSCAFPQKNAIASYFFQSLLTLFESGSPDHLIRECMLSFCLSDNFFSNEEAVAKLKGLIEEDPYPQPLLGFKNQLEALRDFNALPFLDKIKAPTLVVGAGNDILTPLEGSHILAEKIPNATLKVIPNVGHAINVEKPQELLTTIMEYLS